MGSEGHKWVVNEKKMEEEMKLWNENEKNI